MPNFISYKVVADPTVTTSTASFSGPLDDFLNSIQTNNDTVESATPEESTKSARFNWSSRGVKETPYTTQPQNNTTYTPPLQTTQTKNNVINWALTKVGSPYVWGAKGKNNSFDCSGLIHAAYKANGINVPTSTAGWLSSGKQTVGKTEGQPGDVIITGSSSSPSGRHARLITKNLGNGKYECIEAKGKKYGVVTSTYTVGNDLKNIYRAKQGIKLIKKSKYE